MPAQATVRYLTKTDAARWFHRSERSMSRDITNAIKLADQDMLEHVRLRLEDGTVRPGTEVTIEEIIRLRDQGQNPTWELAVAWLEVRYGRRGDAHRKEAEANGAPPPSASKQAEHAAAGTRELPADPKLRLAVLEAINSELETRIQEKDAQIIRLNTELDRRAEERREENELQSQNNTLMQQIYNLLEKREGSTSVGTSRGTRLLPAAASAEQDRPTAVEAQVVSTPKREPLSEQGSRWSTKPPGKKGQKKKRTAPKQKSRAPKRRKQSKPAESKPPKKSTENQVSTFGRFARSLFGR